MPLARAAAALLVAATLAPLPAAHGGPGVPGPRAGDGRSGTGHRLPFRVGAAVRSITPPRKHSIRNDPADCAPAAELEVYDGPRHFAFEDPYVDEHHVGHYQSGDPYLDCAHVGRWVGNLIGGGSSSPRFYDRVADPVTARAMVVSNGRRLLGVEVVDNEGLFTTYAHRIRRRVRADGIHLAGLSISSTHDESAPDTLGLGGVNAATSGVNPFYTRFLVRRAAQAVEAAYRHRRPARIRYAEAREPHDLLQCWSSYPYVDDPLMPALQAVDRGGHTIVTLASVSQHAETLGFNPNQRQQRWLSGDLPYRFRQRLQRAFGGVGIEMAGSVGSVETPEVYRHRISRRPQRHEALDHPAGCNTVFRPHGTALPTGYRRETRVLGHQLGGAVVAAIRRHATWSHRTRLWRATAPVCIRITNALFEAAGAAGVFGGRAVYEPGCREKSPEPPAGNGAGTSIRTSVGAFQIGDGGFLELPGEVFPYTYLRGPLGPADLPEPYHRLPRWPMPSLRTPYRFFDGLADDMVGYIFPRGDGVGVPGEHPAHNPDANGDDRFGCGHSDDAESASSRAADDLGTPLVGLLHRRFGSHEPVRRGRYVLPGGRLSRNPLGATSSLQCTRHTVVRHPGRAVAVWLPHRGVVRPHRWLSLSGRAQRRPDRDTRGWVDRRGRHHWLDVYPRLRHAPRKATGRVARRAG